MKLMRYVHMTRRELALLIVAAMAMGACAASLAAFAYVRSATAGCPIDTDEPDVRPVVIASKERA